VHIAVMPTKRAHVREISVYTHNELLHISTNSVSVFREVNRKIVKFSRENIVTNPQI
jgi:hypothetical protein